MGEVPNKNEWNSGQKSANEASERSKSTVNENRSADQIKSDTRREIDRTVPGILKKD